MMNIQQKVQTLIDSDMDYGASYDMFIERQYNNSTPDQKDRIDLIFINLCGYGLGTILANTDDSLLKDLGLNNE